MAQADVLGPLRRGGEEDLGGGGVGVLLEEVMFDFPGVVDAEIVGELDLIEGVLEELLLLTLAPGLGQLVFVEDPNFISDSVRVGLC